MQGGERYNSINDYLKSVFGRKTVKLSIDAGFTCPNRDGSKGYGGCHFCSEGGSGELASRLENASGLHESMKESITAQIDRLSAKWPDACYIAYFQSFSGTYAPVDYLRAVYYAALSDPRISGIAISTRPDCLPDEVLDLLSDINRDYFMWTELGLQSIHKKTADDMNLCYDVNDYDEAVRKLSSRGIRFVTHLILGKRVNVRGEQSARLCSSSALGHAKGRPVLSQGTWKGTGFISPEVLDSSSTTGLLPGTLI